MNGSLSEFRVSRFQVAKGDIIHPKKNLLEFSSSRVLTSTSQT